jgi:hypothetical protein
LTLVKTVEIDIGVKGDAASKAKLDEISRRAEELKKAFPEYALKINSEAAKEKLRVFRADLASVAKDRTVNVKVKVDDSELAKLAKKMQGKGGPSWLGPALVGIPAIATLGGVGAGAAIGLAGGAAAGAGALAAFGAVAKPVLADALKAAQAVNTAQNTYQATIAAGVPKAQAQLALQTANAKAVLTYNAAIAGGANPAKALAAEHLTLAKNQLTYNAATNAGAFNVKAYRAEQLAIAKAYAELSPSQVKLSQQLGNMANAWQDLKAKQTPVVAGALQPWLKAVTDLTKNLGPIIAAVAPVIGDIGRQMGVLVNSSAFTIFRDWIASIGSQSVAGAGNLLTGFLDAMITLLPQFNPLIQGAATWMSGLGDSLAHWGSSQKTADQITKFMAWFHDNGPLVGGLLKNIGGALGNLAPGLAAGGALELKVISDFLGLVAKLPKGIATPLAEVAGALIILNKLGVVSVGIKILGLGGAGGAAAGGAAAAGLWSKLLPGVRLAGGALVASVIVGMILKNTPSGPGKNWFDNPFGQGTFTDPKSGKQGGTPTPLTSNAEFAQHWLASVDSVRHAFASLGHGIAGAFDDARHGAAAAGHEMAHVFDNVRQAAAAAGHLGAHIFDDARHGAAVAGHDIAHSFDDARHGAATAVADIVTFMKSLPGKILTALGDAGKALFSWGSGALNGMLSGMEGVIGAIGTFISSIPGKILSFLGIKSPPQWAIDAGKHIMNGLGIGMTQAQAVFTKASAAAAKAAANAATGAFSGAGFHGGGSNAANRALGQQMAAAAGWTGAQWRALDTLIGTYESGWSSTIKNPGSSASGIAQNIAGFGPGYQYGNAPQQIAWLINYIRSRYGNPERALAFELSHTPHWYDQGGWLPPGISLAVNATGRPERILPPGGDGSGPGMGGVLGAGRAAMQALIAGFFGGMPELLAVAKQAAKLIADRIKTEIAYAQGVKASTIAGLNLTGIDLTQGTVGTGMQSYLDSIKAFTAQLKALSGQHLNKDLLGQLIGAGPVTGGQYATSILQGGGAGPVNALYKQIQQQSALLGAQAAMSMYGGKVTPKGDTYNVTMSASLTTSEQDLALKIIQAIRQYKRRHGGTAVGIA